MLMDKVTVLIVRIIIIILILIIYINNSTGKVTHFA